jgi:hypothetical protein
MDDRGDPIPRIPEQQELEHERERSKQDGVSYEEVAL